jgi:hypothetical protein
MGEKPEGYVTNCYLHPRDEGPVCFDFGHDPEGRLALVRLDRMALLPIELFDPTHPKHAGLMRSLAEAGANVRAGREPFPEVVDTNARYVAENEMRKTDR